MEPLILFNQGIGAVIIDSLESDHIPLNLIFYANKTCNIYYAKHFDIKKCFLTFAFQNILKFMFFLNSLNHP